MESRKVLSQKLNLNYLNQIVSNYEKTMQNPEYPKYKHNSEECLNVFKRRILELEIIKNINIDEKK